MAEAVSKSSGVLVAPQANLHQREARVWTSGTLVAACFACSLTLINGKMQGLAALTALRLCCFAIPTLGFNVWVGRDPDNGRYRFGCLTALIPVSGAVAAIGGISAFVFSYDRLAGTTFLVLSCLLAWYCSKAEEYAKSRRQKATQPVPTGSMTK